MFQPLQGHHQDFYLKQVLKYCVHYWDTINVYK